MKTVSTYTSAVTTLAFMTISCFTPESAFAQTSDEWVKPMTGLVDSLRGGAVTIGALIVGLAVVIRGIMMALSGNPDWSKIGMVIVGGVLIMAGPSAIAALLTAAQA